MYFSGAAPRFQCILCTAEGNKGDYCLAEGKSSKRAPQAAQDLLKKFQDGTEWELSKVKCATDAKPDYVATPIKQVVDLGLSTFTASKEVVGSKPVPPTKVGQVAGMCEASAFDLVSYVTDVSDAKVIGTDRQVVEAVLEDGSMHGQMRASLRVSIWSAAGDMKYHALLEDARLKGVPVIFFGLFGKRVANGYAVSLGRHGFLKLAAPEDVPSGVSWTDIMTAQGEKRFLMETTYVDDKSYAGELAFETYACVLQKCLVCTIPSC